MRVLFACAGTGGHLLPAAIVARGLLERRPEAEVLFCLADDGRGSGMLEKQGFRWETVPARPFPRRPGLAGLRFPVDLTRGFARSLSLLNRFDPHVVVGTGGYASGPVLLAARLKGIPVILQEQNSVPGLTNRLLAPFAREIHVAWPEAVDFPGAPSHRVFLTGNPVACNGSGRAGLTEPRESRGDPPLLLIMGGSQGAHAINRIMVGCLRDLDPLPARVVFQTGERDEEWVRRSLADRTPRPEVRSFIDDLASIYRRTDLAVCRAGAMTLSEIACWGIPSILIPYPHAAGGHQDRNAAHFVRAGAAVAIPEKEADPRVVGAEVRRLLGDAAAWRAMARSAFELRRPGARDVLVERILALGR
jgi:UDP-N-acetylglucosamine--N-acetylmuramyl-(pentapeptide) pyrophosphoryl-undecaprenol N-acetylglucosamine transferase